MNVLCHLGRGTALLAALALCGAGCGPPVTPPKPVTTNPGGKPEAGSGHKSKTGGGVDVPGEMPEKAGAGDSTEKPEPKEGEPKEGEPK